jgi:hypothetical protein
MSNRNTETPWSVVLNKRPKVESTVIVSRRTFENLRQEVHMLKRVVQAYDALVQRGWPWYS